MNLFIYLFRVPFCSFYGPGNNGIRLRLWTMVTKILLNVFNNEEGLIVKRKEKLFQRQDHLRDKRRLPLCFRILNENVGRRR
jgi:hypothetical protein